VENESRRAASAASAAGSRHTRSRSQGEKPCERQRRATRGLKCLGRRCRSRPRASGLNIGGACVRKGTTSVERGAGRKISSYTKTRHPRRPTRLPRGTRCSAAKPSCPANRQPRACPARCPALRCPSSLGSALCALRASTAATNIVCWILLPLLSDDLTRTPHLVLLMLPPSAALPSS
jgi:hypothetical protein